MVCFNSWILKFRYVVTNLQSKWLLIYSIGTLIPIIFMTDGLALSFQKSYLIGPADILNVQIYADAKKQREIDLTVSEDGIINVPFIGYLKAGGLTFNQLEKLIANPLDKEYFVNPQVHVIIKEYHNLHYFIAGAVKNPGLYETRSQLTLVEIIAKSGGVISDRGNVAHILRKSIESMEHGKDVTKVVISQNEPIKVDLTKLLDQGDMIGNLTLQSGDVIYIPPKQKLNVSESKIYVDGEVIKPGFYDFQPGLTALMACIKAGGFNQIAAPNRAIVIRFRDGQQIVKKLNLNKVKKGTLSDFQLEPGDRIFIPESWL